MESVCEMIARQTDAIFVNLIIALKTYDRNALVKGVPAWRFVYHTLHSADKWFFNPNVYTERAGFEEGSDNPFKPISREWSDEELLALLEYMVDSYEELSIPTFSSTGMTSNNHCT